MLSGFAFLANPLANAQISRWILARFATEVNLYKSSNYGGLMLQKVYAKMHYHLPKRALPFARNGTPFTRHHFGQLQAPSWAVNL